MRRLGYYIAAGVIPWVVSAAVVASGFCIALLVLNPPLRTPRDGLVLLLYLFAYHTLLFAIPALAVCGGLALLSRRRALLSKGRLAVFLVSMLVGVTVSLNTGLRFAITYIMFRGFGPFALLRNTPPLLAPLGIWNLAFLTLGLGVLFLCLWFALVAPADQERVSPARRRRAIGLALMLAIAYGLTCVTNLAKERPRVPNVRAMSVVAPEPVQPDEQSASTLTNGEKPNRKVLVLGLDGLSWFVIDAMIGTGDLPNLRHLVQRGTRAALRSHVPAISPSLWTTVATGRPTRDHGIAGFSRFRLPGMRKWLEHGPVLATMNWWNAFNRALSIAADQGWVERSLFSSADRKVAAVWDVAAREGVSVGVALWFNLWPVPKLTRGSYAASDFSGRSGSLYPEDAAQLVSSGDVPRPKGVSRLSPLRTDRVLARLTLKDNESVVRGLRLYRHFRPRLALHYSHFTDAVQHIYWRDLRDAPFFYLSGEADFQHFSWPVRDSYSLVDRWIGAFLEAVDLQTIVIIVSDHGFSFDGYEHHLAPDGVFLIAGPGVRRDHILDDASLEDIVPTILALLNLPISAELPGRVLEGAFEPGLLGELRKVADYGWFEPGTLDVKRSHEFEREFIEKMKALGYVN